jgi:hypothetical protein
MTVLAYLPPFDASDPARAPAELRPGPPDATYGRIEGDVSLVLGVGASFGPRTPRGALDFRARYLESLGLYVDYENQLGGMPEPKRLFVTGLEVRPLFLARWLQGWESGKASRFDQTLDSIGLTLGAVFQQPTGTTFSSRPGLEAALGVEVPLTGHPTGMWLDVRAGARWSDDELGGVSDPGVQGPDNRSLFLSITLAWHQTFMAHIVDEDDRPPR